MYDSLRAKSFDGAASNGVLNRRRIPPAVLTFGVGLPARGEDRVRVLDPVI